MGRREEHKAATRKTLQDTARRLFAEHGYTRTTVRDIAAAAGVTERTFFRYFPSKEDLVLGEILDLIPELQDAVRARPDAEPPYTAVFNALLTLADKRDSGLAVLFSGPPARFLSQPTRPAWPVLLELETGLADVLADRLRASGEDDDHLDLRATVLARACVAAMRSTVFALSTLPEQERSLDKALHLAHRAFTALGHGVR
ncbi:TetR family transcriptional regulator [Actinomadura sp. NPDC047616]|uniref:TetR family transcriptional regulator n=1 Tax=Actinomadura sp. NPDC047616 TaxID=3155914 RepID=UPI0033F8C8FE